MTFVAALTIAEIVTTLGFALVETINTTSTNRELAKQTEAIQQQNKIVQEAEQNSQKMDSMINESYDFASRPFGAIGGMNG